VSAFVRLLETATRYAQLLRSQYWRAEQLHVYQEERLQKALAASKIPFYAERFGDVACLDGFRQLPILRRADVDSLNSSARSLYPPGSRFPSGFIERDQRRSRGVHLRSFSPTRPLRGKGSILARQLMESSPAQCLACWRRIPEFE
jgi:hypothetical protein